MHRSVKSAIGFTLLEVMVSLLILSIGLLGLAGLQMAGLRSNQNSYYRLQATLLAQDLAERMRANLAGVKLGAYEIAIGALDTDCTNTVCNPAQMANFDLVQWQAEIARQLPSGIGEICKGASGCGSGAAYTIKIRWDEKRSGTPDRAFEISFLP